MPSATNNSPRALHLDNGMLMPGAVGDVSDATLSHPAIAGMIERGELVVAKVEKAKAKEVAGDK